MNEKLIKQMSPANKCKEDMNENIYKWYSRNFVNDDEADFINKEITFYDLYAAMVLYTQKTIGNDPYQRMMIDGDSVVRERVFFKMAEIMDVDYNSIYDLWINPATENDMQISLMFEYMSNMNKLENINENKAMEIAKHEFNMNALSIAKILMFCTNEDISFVDIINEYDSIIIGNYAGTLLYGKY